MKIGQPETLGFSSERLARIAPVLQRYVDEGKVAGMTALIARHGQVAYAQSFGWRDKEADLPLEMDTIVRIYSMTKPITSVAVMMLYEQAKFQLNDPVSKYIPAFANMKVGSGTPNHIHLEPLEQPITIKHLLTHTAGLAYGLSDNTLADVLYESIAKKVWEGLAISLADLIGEITALPLANQPGACWRYSVAIDVLGYLVQLWADMPFDDFCRERIFGPLGMVDTHFCLPKNQVGRLASLYVPDGKGGLALAPQPTAQRCLDPETWPSGGGGLVSTTSDYLRFGQMLLNGGELDGVRLLGRKTVELMTMNHLPAALLPYDLGNPHHGQGFGLGGTVVMDVAATGLPGSVGVFGWGGAAATYFRIDPQEDMLVLLMPQLLGNPYPFRDQFHTLAYQALVD